MRHTVPLLVATLFQVSLPLIAALIYWKRPNVRSRLTVVFGAMTPFFLVYVLMCGSYPFRDTSNPHADRGLEIAEGISILPYLSAITVAVGLSYFTNRNSRGEKYLIGLIWAPVLAFVILAVISSLMGTV
jgi:hypothetical protein